MEFHNLNWEKQQRLLLVQRCLPRVLLWSRATLLNSLFLRNHLTDLSVRTDLLETQHLRIANEDRKTPRHQVDEHLRKEALKLWLIKVSRLQRVVKVHQMLLFLRFKSQSKMIIKGRASRVLNRKYKGWEKQGTRKRKFKMPKQKRIRQVSSEWKHNKIR